ncbi:MAG: glycosyltransferase family 1 protein [Anaerolineae bacterium]|nr:glycosyltransferase family 4 protein [Thermoflexales bacterium]MDW8406211.1 glycosyltransferase family 1 protein [Anaerolineae bacterium]
MIIGIDASRASGTTHTGTERYSREVIRALIQAAPQHRFRLYCRPTSLPDQDAWTRLLKAGREVDPRIIRRQRLWTHIGLSAEIIRQPPDALFIPAHVLPIVFGAPSWVSRTRSVVTVHDIGHRRFPSTHTWGQRLYLDWSTVFAGRYASFIIADSEATRQDIHRFYRVPLERIRVAYPGAMPLPALSEAQRRAIVGRFGLDAGHPFALHIGTIQPRKNLRRLTRAWRHVLADWPSAEPLPLLVLAGAAGWNNEATRLRAEIAAQGLSERVRWIGYISDEDKAGLLGAARALVFPSLHEGFGFPVLEAQAAGVPVVCSKTSSLPEVAGDGALLIDPLDERAIAQAVLRILRDESLRTRLVAAGERNSKRFTWQNCACVILSTLEGRA